MKTKLLFVLVHFMFASNAQTKEKATAEAPEVLNIKFQKFPIADFPENVFPVSEIRLIQNVKDSINLGYALKGLTRRVVILRPGKPLTDFLQEHILKMYKNDYKKQGAKMLWVLKDFRLGERITDMRYIYTRLDADTYISKDGNLFKKVFSIDTVLITETDALMTRSYGQDIESAFKILLKVSFQYGDELSNAEEMALEQIAGQSKRNSVMHILTDSVYNEGAYASFEEFIQNKPSILNFEMVLMEGNRVKFVKAGSNSQPVVLDVWGICQKGDIYKYHEWNLIPIEKQGTGFIISNYAENTNKVNRKLFFTALGASQAGAIVGGVMYYQAHADAVSRQLVVKSIPYITDPNKRPVATCIDMETGDFSF